MREYTRKTSSAEELSLDFKLTIQDIISERLISVKVKLVVNRLHNRSKLYLLLHLQRLLLLGIQPQELERVVLLLEQVSLHLSLFPHLHSLQQQQL